MSFELDVTKPVGDIAITTPEGRIVYDVMAITKEPAIMFEAMSRGLSEDIQDQAQQIIQTLASVMVPQNGGPPALELLTQLYDDNVLGLNHLRRLGEIIQETAVGSSPPA